MLFGLFVRTPVTVEWGPFQIDKPSYTVSSAAPNYEISSFLSLPHMLDPDPELNTTGIRQNIRFCLIKMHVSIEYMYMAEKIKCGRNMA